MIVALWADLWYPALAATLVDRAVEIGQATYALPGVRFALWGGGLITFFAGFVSWRAVQRAHRRERDAGVASGAATEAGGWMGALSGREGGGRTSTRRGCRP